jgi:hypothetical protein
MLTSPLSRRELLTSTSCGFGMLAFAGLFGNTARAAAQDESPLSPKQPHFTPKAKRVISMFMQGGPSHVDTFDYKPALERDDGKAPGAGAGGRGNRKLMKSPWKFTPAGNAGLPISELFPKLAGHADDLCVVNSMVTDLPNHPQASVQLHTGSFQFVRPSMGAWVLYGRGPKTRSCPASSRSTRSPASAGRSTSAARSFPRRFRARPSAAKGSGSPARRSPTWLAASPATSSASNWTFCK